MTRLVVLGSCGAWLEPGRASSAFLLDHGGFRIVLDLGYGVLSRLLDELGSTNAEGLDAAVVTHRHADHVADLHGLFRALRLGERDGLPLPLYAGEGVVDVAEERLLLTHFWPGTDRGASRDAAAAVFDGEVLIADEGLTISPCRPGPYPPSPTSVAG